VTHQQEELDRVNSALAQHPEERGPSRLSDRMSLSPLSDGGRSILQHTPAFPGQPGYWPGHTDLLPPGYQQAWPGPGPGYFPEGRGQEGAAQDWPGPYTAGQQPGWETNGGLGGEEGQVPRVAKSKKRRVGGNPYRTVIEDVVKIVEKELKQILKKDINKRVCETYAFVLYDHWWQEEEQKHKERLEQEAAVIANDNRISRAPTITVPDKAAVADLPRIPKPEDLNSLIDKRREHIESGGKGDRLGLGGSLGLGFRGVIPKIRKVQKKEPSPPPSSSRRKSREEGERVKSPRKKDRRKEREGSEGKKTSPKKVQQVKPSSTASVYKAIYSESDSEPEKEEDEKSSSVESSSGSSDSSDSDGSSSDSDSDSDKSGKSPKSRSSSSSKSSSVSRSVSPVASPAPAPSPLAEPVSPLVEPASPSTSPLHSAPSTPTLPSAASPRGAVSPRRSALARVADSATDSAEELEGPAPSTPAQQVATPVKVQHVVSSPPHIMDHCYARPASAKVPITLSGDSESDVPTTTAGQFDHDYTRPRTPPSATKPAPRGRKPKLPAIINRPALPFKPVKYKQRSNPDRFKIIYKFLTEGVDVEDVMYLKRSYEMVSGEGLL
jgi:hypothetical protein